MWFCHTQLETLRSCTQVPVSGSCYPGFLSTWQKDWNMALLFSRGLGNLLLDPSWALVFHRDMVVAATAIYVQPAPFLLLPLYFPTLAALQIPAAVLLRILSVVLRDPKLPLPCIWLCIPPPGSNPPPPWVWKVLGELLPGTQRGGFTPSAGPMALLGGAQVGGESSPWVPTLHCAPLCSSGLGRWGFGWRAPLLPWSLSWMCRGAFST